MKLPYNNITLEEAQYTLSDRIYARPHETREITWGSIAMYLYKGGRGGGGHIMLNRNTER